MERQILEMDETSYSTSFSSSTKKRIGTFFHQKIAAPRVQNYFEARAQLSFSLQTSPKRLDCRKLNGRVMYSIPFCWLQQKQKQKMVGVVQQQQRWKLEALTYGVDRRDAEALLGLTTSLLSFHPANGCRIYEQFCTKEEKREEKWKRKSVHYRSSTIHFPSTEGRVIGTRRPAT